MQGRLKRRSLKLVAKGYSGKGKGIASHFRAFGRCRFLLPKPLQRYSAPTEKKEDLVSSSDSFGLAERLGAWWARSRLCSGQSLRVKPLHIEGLLSAEESVEEELVLVAKNRSYY